MVNLPEPKKAVSLIRELVESKGAKVQTKEAYELLARLWGYKNWATYRGMNPEVAVGQKNEPAPAVYARTSESLQGWNTWVVANRYDDNGEEQLFLLPPGATLEKRLNPPRAWHLVDDEDAVELQEIFDASGELLKDYERAFVATRVACQYPRGDRYGIPMMANEREVAAWLQEDIGWGYLADEDGHSLVEVFTKDTGDDSLALWWAELRVRPDVHQQLLKHFSA